jgi:amidase
MLTGRYMQDRYHGRYYAKAQNLSRKLKKAYNEALEEYDLLLLPTLPMKATPLPAPDAPREEIVQRALEMIYNTCPFDVTGHPAMNVPCTLSDDLPIGMMLVGKYWNEATVLRAAHAFEQTGTYGNVVRPARAAAT